MPKAKRTLKRPAKKAWGGAPPEVVAEVKRDLDAYIGNYEKALRRELGITKPKTTHAKSK
jgi:hypothetical protein